jgi:hypothetical protein
MEEVFHVVRDTIKDIWHGYFDFQSKGWSWGRSGWCSNCLCIELVLQHSVLVLQGLHSGSQLLELS